MNFLIFAACLLPAVLTAPERRLVEPFINGNAFDLETLKCDMQLMIDVIGSDPTEKTCEAECHNLLQQGHILNYGCPLVCHGFQNLVHMFHLSPQTNDGSDPCAKINVTTASS